MSSAAGKDVKALLRRVAKLPGWTVERARAGHIKVRLHGQVMVIVPSTPGDNRTIQNLRADLKRKGCPL